MKNKKISGIILHTMPLFEYDKRVELLTEKEGKISLLAKYANKRRSKFGGLLDINIYIQGETYQSKSFLLLTQANLKQNFPTIKTSLDKLSLSMYCSEIVRRSTSFNQPNPPLFYSFKKTLEEINTETESLSEIKKNFETQYLISEGLIPKNANPPSFIQFKDYYENYTSYSLPKPMTYNQ